MPGGGTLESARGLGGASAKDLTTLEAAVAAVEADVVLCTAAVTVNTTELAKKTNKAGTPVLYNVTMTNANTEYSQALPNPTRKFLINTQDGTPFRLAFAAGKVAGPTAPYFTIKADETYNEDQIEAAGPTIYFACAQAGKIIQIIAWG